jgi:hypothetical protein
MAAQSVVKTPSGLSDADNREQLLKEARDQAMPLLSIAETY